jgi:hypothetical protein
MKQIKLQQKESALEELKDLDENKICNLSIRSKVKWLKRKA